MQRVTPARVLHSEWIKLRSLRSTALTLAAAVLTMVAMGWIIAWATNRNWSELRPDEQAAFSAIDFTLAGSTLAQLAIGVLGVLLITGEYATGMIRATFGAVPRRLPVLWAKAALYAAVTFVLMLLASLAAFLGGQELLGTHGTTLSAPGAVRAVVGVAGYLTLIGVFAVALGFIIRSTAGGVASLFGAAARPAGARPAAPVQLGGPHPALPPQQRRIDDVQLPDRRRTASRPASACWCSWRGWPRRWPPQPCSSRSATPERDASTSGTTAPTVRCTAGSVLQHGRRPPRAPSGGRRSAVLIPAAPRDRRSTSTSAQCAGAGVSTPTATSTSAP